MQPLERPEEAVEEDALALVDPRHVGAERRARARSARRRRTRAEAHPWRSSASELLAAKQRVDQVQPRAAQRRPARRSRRRSYAVEAPRSAPSISAKKATAIRIEIRSISAPQSDQRGLEPCLKGQRAAGAIELGGTIGQQQARARHAACRDRKLRVQPRGEREHWPAVGADAFGQRAAPRRSRGFGSTDRSTASRRRSAS